MGAELQSPLEYFPSEGRCSRRCPEIDAEIARSAMTASEPWIFVSHNLPKDGKRYSIGGVTANHCAQAYDGPFELQRLELIMAATTIHQGWLRTLFTQGYASLIKGIEESRYKFSGESRELYHGYEGPNAGYQKEIQFGLAY